MKFNNEDELLQTILDDKLIVEMKLKEKSLEFEFSEFGFSFDLYEGKEKWVECKFKDYAPFSRIGDKHKISIIPLDKNFKGKDYYFTDLFYILSEGKEELTKIRVKLKEKN